MNPRLLLLNSDKNTLKTYPVSKVYKILRKASLKEAYDFLETSKWKILTQEYLIHHLKYSPILAKRLGQQTLMLNLKAELWNREGRNYEQESERARDYFQSYSVCPRCKDVTITVEGRGHELWPNEDLRWSESEIINHSMCDECEYVYYVSI